jgi:hypothetical protein
MGILFVLLMRAVRKLTKPPKGGHVAPSTAQSAADKKEQKDKHNEV